MIENLVQNQLFIVYLSVGVVLIIGILIVALFVLRSYLRKQQSMKGGEFAPITLMVTVPRFKSEAEAKADERSADVKEDIAIAETFFSAIGGLKHQKGIKAWFFGRTDEIAFEMVAYEKLITFYITVPKYMHQYLEQQLNAQYSSAAIEPVKDYNIFSPKGTIVGGYLTFKRESALPIKTYADIEGDPLNSITNALSKVPEGDGVAIQYVVRSAPPGWRNMGKDIVKNMKKGMSYKDAKKGGASEWGKILKSQIKQDGDKPEESKQLSPAEQKMMDGIEKKSSKAGLEVNIRVVASAQSPDAATMYLNQVLQAFSSYNIYEFGNAFDQVLPKRSRLIDDFIFRRFRDKYRIVLNTEEMASVWHLPIPTTETPNIRWMLARIAPAPPEIPTSGLHMGSNVYRGHKTEIYMNDEDRTRHMYILGKTGTGKSYFMRYLINQDIKNGKGVAVIDPHGDLVEYVIGTIPKERIDDVVYFNPSDIERPMGLNMLEATGGQADMDFAVQEMIATFYSLFPPEMMGPMFEHYMRNFMLTLMADAKNPGTIAEIPKMIADKKFQDEWIAKVTDPAVKSFWMDEMANTSDYHRSETMGYLVSKVGRFVENEMIRNIIGQPRSAFNFRKIMDEGKILLVNLSKGKIGDVNGNLLGLIIVSKLQMAAFGRADIPEDQRRDFYLYIDEFQNFITPSIATILSEARKYRLNLILANQYMGQLVKDGKSETRDAILGNVGTTLVSRIGPEDVEVLTKLYEPTLSGYDLMNNDKFTWNARLIVDMSQTKPFTLKAALAEKPNPKLAEALREVSRLTYGRPKELVQREIALRSGYGMAKNVAQPQMPTTR
ncbi:MAG: hypothetical protein ACD_66C00061G0001 [uncultured bacterium]|uniref:Type IV secretion system coupling protein TraD DNA-binding domain-containing protein n=1 Tax=Candidatus Uhrbacteria bacterium GW2011_GWC1_41_20 TaxID=1618983 RepID=A0A0G0VDR4_9BACT|nr:MAG: hypothetical protein ACD_66C00061G0001 [uncultured bacterium]KKR22527.1 MAG: hypothetical protein UT52_C0012G0022 [Candidatus Uhrbacteria bacterium GW2011_GWE1_39_46]KKR63858.1 MAG: hypothetical protein UU04_C0010G0015 [Candidatus Uhrbacteria bacterium GW2011_GWC2_40_450]KKR90070.1 MAG: hypothetical protein UU40_C0009G0022 [Candidatus Uhrbacteria bacterium GW2011_GWD2_41_121]KKR96030.1 MAG: hypothetical protein UU46_C0009G0019 [Candidatus Uhrbacteria bacterium GW2011_GWD1_41_16]KKR9904